MTPPSFSFDVPGEPMPKERAEPTVRGKRVVFRTGDRTADYEARVRLVAQANRPANWPLRCRYRMDIVVCRSEKGDIDNYTKAAADSLNPRRAKYAGKGARKRLVRAHVPGVLWIDDCRVYEGSQRIVDVAPKEARLIVTVCALPVPCVNKRCGGKPTFYPDDGGRCEECAARKAA
mgnify:FL=1